MSMRNLIVGILGVAIGSTFSLLLSSTNVEKSPCLCKCDCGENSQNNQNSGLENIFSQSVSSSSPSSPSYPQGSLFQPFDSARQLFEQHTQTQPLPPPPPPQQQQAPCPVVPPPSQTTQQEQCFTPPPPVDIDVAEEALTRYHGQKWGAPKTGRELLLCYGNNNQQLVDEEGKKSYMWDPAEFAKAGGEGQLKIYSDFQQKCVNSEIPVNFKSTVNDKFKKVMVNGKFLTFDDIVFGYERIFQSMELFSAVSWLGVSMQQTPNDAFVIADMMWRLRPDLIIELGTSGGGSAHFFAHIMQQYNPKAKVLTMDPALPGAGAQGGPLIPWNSAAVKRFCPHCTRSNETVLWKKGNIRFLHMYPTSPEALSIAEEMSKVAKRVMVIEDSTHQREVVLENIKAYGKFVTPGSYLLVQDTRGGRWKPADAVNDFLNMPEGFDFSVDPRWEYMVFSQHSGGFLRKSGSAKERV